MADRLALVMADEHIDIAIEGGGEQQRLATRRCGIQDAPYGWQKAHVGHAVGLIDDDHVDVGKENVAGAHEVLEPAGAGHRHVDGLSQRVALGAKAHTAVEGVHLETPGLEQRGQLGRDLSSQLASRGKHETAWSPGRTARQLGRHG